MFDPNSKLRRAFSYLEDQVLSYYVEKKKNETSATYQTEPLFTAIVQTFNKRRNISKIVTRLRSSNIGEIIVIDDGSIDGTTYRAKNILTGTNEFLIRSNDLHEVIMYKKALRFASGDIVCLLQDDDFPPTDGRWLDKAETLFENFPKLLILGGKGGQHLQIPESPPPNGKPEYVREGNVAGMAGVNKYSIVDSPGMVDPDSGISFEFVSCVHRAPMLIRKKEFIEMGSISLDFAPYQCDDIDACIRAWKNGWKVGLYNPDFDRSGRGGQSLYAADDFSQQAKLNWKKIYNNYRDDIQKSLIKSKSDKANEGLASSSTS